jgi:replicative DNA helicase
MESNIHSFDTECSVLSSIILEPALLDQQMIGTGLFYETSHKQIASVLIQIYLEKGTIDPITVADRIQDQGLFPQQSALQYITELCENNVGTTSYKDHIRLLQRYKSRRKLYNLLDDCSVSVAALDKDPTEIIETLQSELLQIQGKTGEHDGEKISDALVRYIQELDGRITGVEPDTTLITGISQLDKRLTKLYPGHITVIGGRPSHGKTVLAMQIATNAAISGHRVLVFTLEMMNIELAERVVSAYAGIKLKNLMTTKINNNEWTDIQGFAENAKHYDITLYEINKLKLNTLMQIIRMEHFKKPIDLIILDYIQLMSYPSHKEVEALGDISKEIKSLCKSLQMHAVVVSQLNRYCEARKDKRPMMSDLKASGQIEQDASNIVFCYRDEVYNKDDQNNKGIIELITDKARKGVTGIDTMTFEGEYQRIVDLKPRYTFGESNES